MNPRISCVFGDVLKRTRDFVFSVEGTFSVNGIISSAGSAFLVWPNLMFTCQHVTMYQKEMMVRNKHLDTKAKVIGFSVEEDVALLKLEIPSDFGFLSIRPSHYLRRGDKLGLVGYAGNGLDFPKATCTIGNALGMVPDCPDCPDAVLLATTCLATGGNSGCPAVDARGRACGILGMKHIRSGFPTFCNSIVIPIERAIYLSEEILIDEGAEELVKQTKYQSSEGWTRELEYKAPKTWVRCC